MTKVITIAAWTLHEIFIGLYLFVMAVLVTLPLLIGVEIFYAFKKEIKKL